MGFLTEGKALNWIESLPYLKKIKLEGIKQFLYAYQNAQNLSDIVYPFKFGDEIEYSIYVLDDQFKTISVQLNAQSFIEQLNQNNNFQWHPEYADYMIEGLPIAPYEGTLADLLKIESDLIARRSEIIDLLGSHQKTATITCFPRLGCQGSSPLSGQNEPISNSNILSDSIIGHHMRFHALTQNIRLRRGSKVEIKVPIYRDINVHPDMNEIIMDCMAFGMGCSCLQQTIQMENESDARYLYDQLAIIAPLLLCLTAASPAYCGYLSDTDCRWDIIAASVDDRKPDEKNNIKKSRYSSISLFIGNNNYMKDEYNDFGFAIDNEINDTIGNNIDHLLKSHLNYLFIRDPLVIYENDINTNSQELAVNKYENIHSTNWNTVRLKVPISEECGWRVEFRPMELQSSDFSNSAFLVFISLLARAIIKYRPNWYLPISLVDINMSKAQKRNAVIDQTFYFTIENQSKVEQLTIKKIVNEHLLPIVNEYLSSISSNNEELQKIDRYLNFVRGRANGEIPTDATRIRDFVINHPSYQRDSYISNEICYDLMKSLFF